ncbi:hypothetical protein Tco_1483777 [Tanacetum coccineum]
MMKPDNDLHESDVTPVSHTHRNTVANNLLNAELATYKEQVELYERRARITPTGINEGERVFEPNLDCYSGGHSFFKTLQELWRAFKKPLTKEKGKNLLIEHDNIIADSLSKEVFYVASHSELNVSRFTEMQKTHDVVKTRCLELEAEGREISNLRDNGPLFKTLWTVGSLKALEFRLKKFIGKFRFGGGGEGIWHHFGAIMGYRDYVIGESVISRGSPTFLWAELWLLIVTHKNRSLIHTRHDKTPYELVHNKKPDLTFFRVFGALCYPTNDSENLGKLQPTADIGIFVGLVTKYGSAYTICISENKDLEMLFHPCFDEYFNHRVNPSESNPSILRQVSPSRRRLIVLLADPEPFVNEFAPVDNSDASSSGGKSTYLKSSQSLYIMNMPEIGLNQHPIDNISWEPSRPVITRKQLATDALCASTIL